MTEWRKNSRLEMYRKKMKSNGGIRENAVEKEEERRWYKEKKKIVEK
jgi:hypothetical protein